MSTGDLFSVVGKRVLVTGGTRGIGLMLATTFAEAGAELHISSRSQEALDRAAAKLRAYGPCRTTVADLSNQRGVARLVAALTCDDRPLHVLVNNAGAAWLHDAGWHPDEELDRLWAVNVKAPLHLVHALSPMLRRAARPGDPARVVNIGSIDGLAVSPVPNYGYSATKAALHMLTRDYARDLAPHVTVNAIAPGLFETDMTASLLADREERERLLRAIPAGRIGAPTDLAGAAVYLASRAGAFVTGVVLPVDGGETGA